MHGLSIFGCECVNMSALNSCLPLQFLGPHVSKRIAHSDSLRVEVQVTVLQFKILPAG